MGLEEGNFEADSARTSQQSEGSEKSDQIFTKSPQDFGPYLSDFVGDLSRTWGNSIDWMIEFRDGRKIVIPLSAFRSPNSVSDQIASEGVVNPGMDSLVNEGQISSWASEYDGVVGFAASELGSEGEPLEVAPLAVDNSVVMESTTVEERGCMVDVDNSKLSLWVTNRLKAFQKSVGTSLEGFEEQVTELSLIDLPLVGGNFTWSKFREVVSSSRLDKFLLSADWEEKFPSVCQRRLSRLFSDHFPIILEGGNLLGGSPSFILANKLKMLKLDLKRWNVEEFGNIGLRVQNLWKDLNVLEVIEEDRVLSAEESLEKDRIHGELEKSTLLEEICWRQKSRALFLKEGDMNTKFFHCIANSHRRSNTIDRLLVDGELYIDEGIIEGISEEDANWLDRPFDEDEVYKVVHDFNGDNAPGPDGFSMAFFQSCWSLVKNNIMNVFHNFHAHAVFEKSLNATFLALIPKKNDAVDVKDFRPISLVGGLYKIIAKTGVPGVLCKLDIEKAYDHVNWEFLPFLLQRGFSDKWRRWIKCCILIVKFSILINGYLSDFFGSTRGLRQGDPLSLFLFDIVMEALSRMLDTAIVAGQFSGFSVGNANGSLLTVSHLLFTDDTLFFYDADSNHMTVLRGILSRFEELLGLKINLDKSELVLVGDVSNMHELVEILGCRESTLLPKYLGLPLGASFKDKTVWNPILEKMERRLVGWKRLYLSKVGKVTLIKSTLSSLPTYFLSLFPIPIKVAKRIEDLQRDFLWNGIGGERKIHLVSWSKVCRPVKNGGLGIQCLRRFNSALLAKWLWRYGAKNDALWRRVIEAKYGNEWGGWCTKSVSGAYGVSLWKFIRRGWLYFSKFLWYDVGDGSCVKFWDDVWCRDRPLKGVFPDLYNISRTRDASVFEVMCFANGRIFWDLQFRRLVNDQESQSLDSCMVLIYSTKV
ncbi:uncharacterized protein LOC136067152 [Quercus suber]|uniref:uncharacterized protein LOC136067152 n=1 Tax=Quercus suber TaxID=58331 RepID=UPI0032E0436C